MDALKTIKRICEGCDFQTFNPRVLEANEIDLTKFEKQKSDIKGIGFEYIEQYGPGFSGDDFHGTMAWPVGKSYFVLDYLT